MVIAIIGILATISVLALNNARAKSRDAKRMADVKQIQTALELYFNDNGRYPTTEEFERGSLYSTSTMGTTSYMAVIPEAPMPPDGACDVESNQFSYVSVNGGEDYKIQFCLGGLVGGLSPSTKCAMSGGILNQECFVCGDLIKYGGGPFDSSGIKHNNGGYYRTVNICDTNQENCQCWFRDNLNIGIEGAQSDDDIIEKHCDDCTLYGGQYNRDEANAYPGWNVNGDQGICPNGWHIPSSAEFLTLVNNLGGVTVAGGKLKQIGTVEGGTGLWGSPNTGATDESGFSAVPGFWAANTRGIYWASDWGSPYYPVMWLQYDTAAVQYLGGLDPSYNMSVRCLKD